ncbi:MAG: serine/threonine-protein kinase [Myxococcota bacterium]
MPVQTTMARGGNYTYHRTVRPRKPQRFASGTRSSDERSTCKIATSIKGPFELGEALDGTFVITGLLGEGGMGLVYEAHDQILNRSVAIKVSWPENRPDVLRREAQAMAALRGRGLPCIYGMGIHHGVNYCVMERLYGLTLAQHIDQRPGSKQLPLAESIAILIGLTETLAGVHRVGLIHCDLKPANIMLAPGDEIILLDFGVFCTEGHGADLPVIRGTPEYVAPEVIEGSMSAGRVHFRDIYSLGCIAYELLAGRPPFIAKSPSQVLLKHVYDRPAKLSSIRSDIPIGLDRIISEMLAKEPELRPFSVEAVKSALLAAQPTRAR